MSKREALAFTPRLRFSEFIPNGTIPFMPGGDLFLPVNRKNDLSGLPVLAITQEYGAIPRDRIHYNVSVTGRSLAHYKIVEAGDFIISLRSFQGGIEFSPFRGICSPAYIVLRQKRELIAHYYKYYFKTGRFIQELNRDLEGIRDGKMVRYGQFSSILLPYPDLREQRKVAECLSSLDLLIDAEKAKLSALQNHKRGLMQKLFPEEGDSLPAWRFPEFRNGRRWVRKELKQLGRLLSGLTYAPGDVRETGLLVLRSSNIKNNRIDLRDCVYVRTDIRGANLLSEHDILICVRNGSKALIGKSALIPRGLPLCTHGAFMTVFRAEEPHFVFQLFQSASYGRQVQADLGATIHSINGQQLKKYAFLIPEDPEERKKIAECLSSIDALITAQLEKVETLKTYKKGLAQRLFPST